MIGDELSFEEYRSILYKREREASKYRAQNADVDLLG